MTVWHNDTFGRNDFLGEVTVPLDYYEFKDASPKWYKLQERVSVANRRFVYFANNYYLKSVINTRI